MTNITCWLFVAGGTLLLAQKCFCFCFRHPMAYATLWHNVTLPLPHCPTLCSARLRVAFAVCSWVSALHCAMYGLAQAAATTHITRVLFGESLGLQQVWLLSAAKIGLPLILRNEVRRHLGCGISLEAQRSDGSCEQVKNVSLRHRRYMRLRRLRQKQLLLAGIRQSHTFTLAATCTSRCGPGVAIA